MPIKYHHKYKPSPSPHYKTASISLTTNFQQNYYFLSYLVLFDIAINTPNYTSLSSNTLIHPSLQLSGFDETLIYSFCHFDFLIYNIEINVSHPIILPPRPTTCHHYLPPVQPHPLLLQFSTQIQLNLYWHSNWAKWIEYLCNRSTQLVSFCTQNL